MDSYELQSRMGRFRIDDRDVKERPWEVMEVMKKMIVIRCEYLYEDLALHYSAISPLFDKVPDGEMAPHYDIKFTDSGPVLERQP